MSERQSRLRHRSSTRTRSFTLLCVHPGTVDTTFKVFARQKEHPTKDDVRDDFAATMMMPVRWLDPVEMSNAVLWLASDESAHVPPSR